ncbi:MAG: DUF3343 domain-containing protein [Treponema sp.]|nr:DUF3343 domain-containing protein [Treponema sp.]
MSDGAALEYVFSFNRTVDAIMGEKCLVDAGVPVMVMPMPAYTGSRCGICLRVEPENFEEAKKLLKDTYSRIFRVTEDRERKTFREQ